MADITTARAGLVTFGATVAKPGGGFFASYDLKGFYDAVAAGTVVIPCLLAVLEYEENAGWHPLTMMGGAAQDEFVMYHFALWKAVANNEDFSYLEPNLLAIKVNYDAALSVTPYLTPKSAPSIHYAPLVHWRMQKSKWKEVQYHGVVFRLECKINL